mmetsp:Transcript_31978/g.31271  ORF Transcript_31978/g.31271 Transcript_31978/m.31271 type:complete len:151 (-) Transcript_31978:2904-3356(-)
MVRDDSFQLQLFLNLILHLSFHLFHLRHLLLFLGISLLLDLSEGLLVQKATHSSNFIFLTPSPAFSVHSEVSVTLGAAPQTLIFFIIDQSVSYPRHVACHLDCIFIKLRLCLDEQLLSLLQLSLEDNDLLLELLIGHCHSRKLLLQLLVL